MTIDLKTLTISKLQEDLSSGRCTVSEVVSAYLGLIKENDSELLAFREVFSDVKEQAQEADKRLGAGEQLPLLGVPIALKDNILVSGKKAESSSKILEGYTAPYDATVVQKLREAGAIIIGRTNMDEFAMGSSTENSAYGPSKNPHDTSRVPGGSSGGSAVAVAADMALASFGSETGGSVRQPAALCGIVGFKPSYGAVSRHGLMAMASSLDQISPFGKTVADAEILFNVVSGEDPMDSTTIPQKMWEKETLTKKTEDIVVGVPYHLVEKEGIDEDVKENFKSTLKKMSDAGMKVEDITLPTLEYSLPVYYVIVPAEVSSNLARFDGVKYGLRKEGDDLLGDYLQTREEGLGAEVKRRILLGTYVLSAGYYDAYYNKARKVQEKIKEEIQEVYKRVDVIALPTTPSPAFKIGEKADDPLALYLSDIFTVSANIAGVPALSLPSGFVNRDGKELPLGFQLMGTYAGDREVFHIGKIIEKILSI